MWVVAYIETRGFPPSLLEIADGLGYKSMATVHKHLCGLERTGYIVRGKYRARDIVIVKKCMKRTESCPVCGRGAAELEVKISGTILGPDLPVVTDSAGSTFVTMRNEDGTFTARRQHG